MRGAHRARQRMRRRVRTSLTSGVVLARARPRARARTRTYVRQLGHCHECDAVRAKADYAHAQQLVAVTRRRHGGEDERAGAALQLSTRGSLQTQRAAQEPCGGQRALVRGVRARYGGAPGSRRLCGRQKGEGGGWGCLAPGRWNDVRPLPAHWLRHRWAVALLTWRAEVSTKMHSMRGSCQHFAYQSHLVCGACSRLLQQSLLDGVCTCAGQSTSAHATQLGGWDRNVGHLIKRLAEPPLEATRTHAFARTRTLPHCRLCSQLTPLSGSFSGPATMRPARTRCPRAAARHVWSSVTPRTFSATRVR